MGLLDILNSMQGSLPPGGGMPTNPRAQPAPGSAAESQGMSPMAKALLGLLAVYAMKHMQRAGSPSPQPGGSAGGGDGGLGDILGGAGGGGLGDLLKGPLGGILGGTLGGAAAGKALNGGLGDLLKQLQQGGQGEAAKSWIGPGPNKAISPSDLGSALGTDTLEQMSDQTGMSQDDILGQLSRYLPHFVDQLTPDGRLPTDQEAARMI